MDGLASFAHDPILPLHGDGDSDFGGDSAENRALQSAMNGNSTDHEANNLLNQVFGDSYFSDRQLSVGSESECFNPTGKHNNNSIQNETSGLSTGQHNTGLEQEEKRRAPQDSSHDSQSDIHFRSYSAGQLSGLHPSHSQTIAMYPNSQASRNDHQIAFSGQNGISVMQHDNYSQHRFDSQQHHQVPNGQYQYQNLYLSNHVNSSSYFINSQVPSDGSTNLSHSFPTLANNHASLHRMELDQSAKSVQNRETSVETQKPASGSSHEPYVLELSDDESDVPPATENNSKRQRIDRPQHQHLPSNHISPASVSLSARNQHIPGWMKEAGRIPQHHRPPSQSDVASRPLAALSAYHRPTPTNSHTWAVSPAPTVVQHKPNMIEIPEDYVSTWEAPIPIHLYRRPQGRRRYELSLINVKEFTITGLPISWDGPPSSLAGLRRKIKELSKDHGKATFERSSGSNEGRWRIPLGAYNSFYSYLTSDPLCQVVGIPQDQLKIASLGKARLEKGYPSTKKLVSFGVPRGLATALAPFQRGGVDFVVEKRGRALIADEMGLGKTVQGIASMSVYHKDWPLLVLTPSSARYHWEHEFQHWLGRDSPINRERHARLNLGGESDDEQDNESDQEYDESNCMPLLDDTQIHVLSSGKDAIIPRRNTKVVICSYGLAPTLAASGKIYPGLFRAAIVDESHMLKNMNTKRTKNLVPVLHATHRCVLLSGTPALAKPTELWPQLKILSTEETGWWEEESTFIDKYVKNSSATRRAELHAMLTGTVMIRRLKNDILKSLPKKLRAKAVVDVSTPDMRIEFHKCMSMLREGKGQLGKLARQHSALGPGPDQLLSSGPSTAQLQFEKAKSDIKREHDSRYMNRMREIEFALTNTRSTLSAAELEECKSQMVEAVKRELQVWYQERLHELQEELPPQEDEEISRKSVLNRMYTLTGKSKLTLISSMLKKWLKDATKGKLCVFAHHIFVLDELVRMAGLSNHIGSETQYIRIDGSTSPKERQAQIKKFQTDPKVRIAILGITAAGVAVTLTASSTVWFAELFWTPALMIQAEDRCHRIGQNSRVQCLYFVATGTLDDLLWKLLEKKFRDLGEFVEGLEKQKIVVHKTYHGIKEVDGIFENLEEESDDEVNFDEDSESEDNQELLKYQQDLQNDIELLGKEELRMMKTDGDDDDFVDETISQDGMEPVAGSTEAEAILLSDDEQDPDPVPSAQDGGEKTKSPAPSDTSKGNESEGKRSDTKPSPESIAKFDVRKPLQGCRGYSIVFEGKSFGMNLFIYEGRAVVGGRVGDASSSERPGLGDVLIAVNGQRMPFTSDINQITTFMKTSLLRGPVELIFMEIPSLRAFVIRRTEKERKRIAELKARLAKPITKGPDDVIDLVDDDE